MDNDIKRIDIKEFRENGYLQEVNRRFFHPLGLALEVIVNKDTTRLGGIWDYRDDPEGMFYAKDVISKEKIDNVEKLRLSKLETRTNVDDLKVDQDGIQII